MCYKTASHPRWGHHPGHRFAKKMMAKKMAKWGLPPVNIEEQDDQYILWVYAAGYQKSDFQINIKDNTLIIRVEKEKSTEVNWRRREFYPRGFERQFELNDKVDKEQIAATYEEGVLKIVLPKLPGSETLRKEVTIS